MVRSLHEGGDRTIDLVVVACHNESVRAMNLKIWYWFRFLGDFDSKLEGIKGVYVIGVNSYHVSY